MIRRGRGREPRGHGRATSNDGDFRSSLSTNLVQFGRSCIHRRVVGRSGRGPVSEQRAYLKVDELARLWRVGRSTIYEWVQQGRIPYRVLNPGSKKPRIRFAPDEIEAHTKPPVAT